jgi:AraC-like DNA-binding protein
MAPRRLESKDWLGEDPVRVFVVDEEGIAGVHTHNFAELVIITGGSGTHVTPRRKVEIFTGDVLHIDAGVEHEYRDVNGLALVNILYDQARMNISPQQIRRLDAFHRVVPLPWNRLRLDPGELRIVLSLVRQLKKTLKERPEGYRDRAQDEFVGIAETLRQLHATSSEWRTRSEGYLGDVLKFIGENYERPLTVAELVSTFKMSSSSLLRAFKRSLGATPIAYITRLRVAKAKELLRDKSLNITEVAFRVGFTDSNYFARRFRKVTGRSPQVYRREADNATVCATDTSINDVHNAQ